MSAITCLFRWISILCHWIWPDSPSSLSPFLSLSLSPLSPSLPHSLPLPLPSSLPSQLAIESTMLVSGLSWMLSLRFLPTTSCSTYWESVSVAQLVCTCHSYHLCTGTYMYMYTSTWKFSFVNLAISVHAQGYIPTVHEPCKKKAEPPMCLAWRYSLGVCTCTCIACTHVLDIFEFIVALIIVHYMFDVKHVCASAVP